MNQIVNLRRVRKLRARGENEKKAAENRAHYGRAVDERNQTQATIRKEAQKLDGALRAIIPQDDA